MQPSVCQEGTLNFPDGIRNPADPVWESVTDTSREPAVQWHGDLPLKLATGFEPPIVQRRKGLRQLIWNIGPSCRIL
jgi:hypothetical protein